MRGGGASGITTRFQELFRRMGQVGHALLTRSPLSPASKARGIPFDLHVLSTPPAFVLSQNQTLHEKTMEEPNGSKKKETTKKPNPMRKHGERPSH